MWTCAFVLAVLWFGTCVPPVHAQVALAQPVAPPEPAVRPEIAATYAVDADANGVEDALEQRETARRDAVPRATPGAARAAAQKALDATVEIEVVLRRQVSQAELNAFVQARGEVTHVFKAVSYGWTGRVPLSQVGALRAAFGPDLALIEEAKPMELHLDTATRTGRVRPIWQTGFAGAATGYRGTNTITIGVIDTGADESHPDLAGRRVYWNDFSSDTNASPTDMPQHGSHVMGIAAGSGAAGGSGSGLLRWSSDGSLAGVPSGSFFPDPIELPGTPVTLVSTSIWNGGGSTTLYHLESPKGGGGWFIDNSIAGSSPQTLITAFTSSTANRYSPGLIQNATESITDFIITSQVTGYPDVGDGFNTFSGVAPGCNWAAAKVFTSAGGNLNTWTTAALDDLTANRVALNLKVLNMSLGVIGNPGLSTTLRQKVNTAVKNGIVLTVSAGNDGTGNTTGQRTIDDPGRAAFALTVASANDANRLTDYTSHGFTSPSSAAGIEEDYKPDVMAPGGSSGYQSSILSVDSNSGDGSAFPDQQTNDYYNIQGTSMASPFAAGVAALVIQALEQAGLTWDFNSATNARLVKMLICATASESNANREDDNFNPTLNRNSSPGSGFPAGKDRYEGYGMINSDAAVEAAALTYTPGNTTNVTLGGTDMSPRVWARRVALLNGQTLGAMLTVPPGGDFDLYVYSMTPAVYGAPTTLGASVGAGNGVNEAVNYTATTNADVLLVVKRVAGSGTFTLSSTGLVSRTLTVSTPYGSPNPPAGTNSFNHGASVTAVMFGSPFILGGPQETITAVCTGWVGTGSAPSVGSTTNTGAFAISTNSSITWLWAISDRVLSNQVVSSSTTVTATRTIRARTGYQVIAPGDVDLRAGQEIRLQPGFHAITGSVFRATIDPTL